MSFWTEFRDVAKIVVGVVAAFYGYYGVLLTAVSDVYGRDQRRQLRKQARAEFLKSLKDRYQMVRSATESRKSIYGRARVSGPIVYAQSTGAKKEFLHLVIALAGRECDAIEGVLFNDVLLPAEDGSGFIQSGEYARTDILDVSDTFSGTSKTLAFTPSSIVVVTRVTGSGDGSSSVILNSPADYTLAGATLTIPGGGAGVIEYQRTQVTPRVRIKKFLGTTTQAASSDLITESGGVKWTSAHQLKGICYLYVRLEYDQNIFGQSGLPNVSAIVRGNKLYDPRLDSTAGGSGAHRIATPSTWAWSENSALATSDFLRDAQFGMVAAAAETPAAETIDAANSCDDAILIYNAGTVTVTNGSPNVSGGSNWLSRARPGMLFVSFDLATYVVKSVTSNTALVLTTNYAGTTQAAAGYTLSERRYTCNGVLDSGDAARNNLDRITESMAGSVTWVQGRWRIRAGIHFSSTLTITESMLGDRSPVISPRSPRQELFNRVTATYAEPEKLYTEMQAPPVTNATYLSDDGGLELPVELALDMVTGGVRAQRLSKIHFEVQRQALTVRLNTNLSAYDTAPGDVVALTLARYGWSSKLFVILERKFDLATRQIDFVLRETASGVWDWALGAETAIDLTPNTDLPSPFTPPPALTGMAAASGTAQLMRLPDGTILTRALITWSASTDAFVFNGGRIEVRWKTDAAADWTVEPSVPGDSTSAVIGPMDDLRVTIAQIRPVNARGRFGAWTSVAFVSVGKSAAPANVSGLAAITLAQGARISWSDNIEADYESTELRHGASWAAGVRIFRGNASAYNWVNPAIGVYTVWAKHFDTTGNESATAVSVSVTVLYQGDVNASADLRLVETLGSGQYTVRGNSVFRSAGGGLFDATIASTEAYQSGAFFSFKLGATGSYFLAGLSRNPAAADPTTDGIKFITRADSNLGVRVYPAGTETTIGAFVPGDIVSMSYEGTTIKCAVNGITKLTVHSPAIEAGAKFQFALSSVATAESNGITDIRFGPLSGPGTISSLNRDPDCSDPTAWSHAGAVTEITGGITGRFALSSTDGGSGNHIYNLTRSPLDSTKAYRLRCLARKVGTLNGAPTFYLGFMGFDSTGAPRYDLSPPYSQYSISALALTTSFAPHEVVLSAAAVAALNAGIAFISPHVILGYTGGGTAMAPGLVQVQDVRLEEIASTATIEPNAATEIVAVNVAGPITTTAMTTIVTANFGPYPYDTSVECTFVCEGHVKGDPDFVGAQFMDVSGYIDGSVGTDSAVVIAMQNANIAEQRAALSVSHTFALPANTAGSASGRAWANGGISTAPAPAPINEILNASLRATVVKR